MAYRSGMAAALVSEILREGPLLADLASEYQKLKASGERVDYRAWIRGKLGTPSKSHHTDDAEPASRTTVNQRKSLRL